MDITVIITIVVNISKHIVHTDKHAKSEFLFSLIEHKFFISEILCV